MLREISNIKSWLEEDREIFNPDIGAPYTVPRQPEVFYRAERVDDGEFCVYIGDNMAYSHAAIEDLEDGTGVTLDGGELTEHQYISGFERYTRSTGYSFIEAKVMSAYYSSATVIQSPFESFEADWSARGKYWNENSEEAIEQRFTGSLDLDFGSDKTLEGRIQLRGH